MRSDLRRLAHRALARACAAVVAVVLAAPLLLGSAFGATLAQLGDHDDHFCACGMKPGTCGCPACARLGKLRAESKAHDREHVVARSSCDDSPAPPGVPSLPEGVVPASFEIARAPSTLHVPAAPPPDSRGRGRDRPALPPPRTVV